MTQWYLGVDVGTTGISAALLHRQTQKIYPIYWQAEQTELSEVEDIPFTFRLPSQVYYLDPHQDTTQGLVQRFKPLLNLAIPYDKSTDSPELIGLPIIQWSEQQTLPLRGFRQAWTALLSTLHPGRVRSDHRIYPGRSPNRGTAPL
ncbi:MAG TPA: hypothetical protein DEF27_12185, partial [Oscillatoriales bacterium UBA8482]|nr:hypothetical protein [Oscillatoriales bacterium UBA8482]